MVLIRGARMQDMRIRQKLNIAYVQHHMQREPVAGLLKHPNRVQLGGRERRDDARVGEAGQRADVVGVPSGWLDGYMGRRGASSTTYLV